MVKLLFTLPDPVWNRTVNDADAQSTVVWMSSMMQYISPFVGTCCYCCVHSVTHQMTHPLFLCRVCVCVYVALVVAAAELEQLSSYSPRVHGLPYLRWGEGSAAEVHSQAWQVRHKHTEPHVYANIPRDTLLVVSLDKLDVIAQDVVTFGASWCECGTHFKWLCHQHALSSAPNKPLLSVIGFFGVFGCFYPQCWSSTRRNILACVSTGNSIVAGSCQGLFF